MEFLIIKCRNLLLLTTNLLSTFHRKRISTVLMCTHLRHSYICYYSLFGDHVCLGHIKAEWPMYTWRRHHMETFSALLVLCTGNSPVTGQFPSQRPVTRSFGVFFDLRPNKRLGKQSWGWWFETPSCSLWRHCNASVNKIIISSINMSPVRRMAIVSSSAGLLWTLSNKWQQSWFPNTTTFMQQMNKNGRLQNSDHFVSAQYDSCCCNMPPDCALFLSEAWGLFYYMNQL